MKQNVVLFTRTQKQKQLLMKVTLRMYLNQFILRLYQTDSFIDHNINISKYNPLSGSSYIILSKEINHSKKGLINIQNINDNECFK